MLAAVLIVLLGAPSDDDVMSLLKEGAALSASGDHAGALALFERAHALQPQAFGPLFNMAVELEALGRTGSAWLRFVDARALAEKAGDERAAKAVRRIEALQPSLAWVAVEGEVPSGATVSIQSVVVSATAAKCPVDPGVVEVVITAPGFEPWTQHLDAPPAGQRSTVTVSGLRPVEPATPKAVLVPEALPEQPVSRHAKPEPSGARPAQPVARRADPVPTPARAGALGLMVSGIGVACLGLVGVLVSAVTLGDLERQRVGQPGAQEPRVALSSAQTLAWGYPLSWFGLGAGAGLALLGGLLAWPTR